VLVNRTNNSRTAFTLTELMISIALVLVLIIGVNRVFKYTTDTVGTEAAISSAMRDIRAGERTLRHDFDAMVSSSEQPAIIITTHLQYAFRNQQDQLTDLDNDPRTDVDPLNPTGTIDYSTVANEALPTMRRHRLDSISFFTRDISKPYKRQTGSGNTLVYTTSSPEAWIFLGPLWLPDNTGTFAAGVPANSPPPTYPGAGTTTFTNPNNFYASQWQLGRQTILMKSQTDIAPNEPFMMRAAALTPLQYDSQVGSKPSAGANPTPLPAPVPTIEQATCDLAGRTISEFRSDVAAAGANFWLPLTTTTGTAATDPPYLFQADPQGVKPSGGGITSDSASKSSSVFMGSCSQFVVEYAGDFVTQDATGTYTAAVPDGVMDFVVIPTAGAVPERRMIQWYGYPRDTSSPTGQGPDGTITSAAPLCGDVLPLVTAWPTAGAGAFPFEVVTPTPSNRLYTAAFGPTDLDGTRYAPSTPRKPKMIRVIVQIADAPGRLADGQNFEYVFSAK
jgi:hypothetical protein